MADFISVDTTSLERLGYTIKTVRAEAVAPFAVGDDIAAIALKAIREEAPKKSGRLARTMYSRVLLGTSGQQGRQVIYINTNEKYAKWVIEGRGWVYPVRAKVLHWVSESGEDVFSMSAKPTEPNPFHERGWKRAEPALRARLQRYADSVARRLAS